MKNQHARYTLLAPYYLLGPAVASHFLYSSLGLTHFGLSRFGLSRFGLSRFGHGTFQSWLFRSRDISVRL